MSGLSGFHKKTTNPTRLTPQSLEFEPCLSVILGNASTRQENGGGRGRLSFAIQKGNAASVLEAARNEGEMDPF